MEKLSKKLTETEKKIEEFSDLLDTIESSENKKKALWREIYSNAICDRESASMLFTNAFQQMQGTAIDHATLGTTLTKYLERMCKSNEQILRLADLIAKAEDKGSSVDPEDIFAKIEG